MSEKREGAVPPQDNKAEKSEREPVVDLQYVSSILDMAIDGVKHGRDPKDTEEILNKAKRLVDEVTKKLEK